MSHDAPAHCPELDKLTHADSDRHIHSVTQCRQVAQLRLPKRHAGVTHVPSEPCDMVARIRLHTHNDTPPLQVVEDEDTAARGIDNGEVVPAVALVLVPVEVPDSVLRPLVEHAAVVGPGLHELTE